VEEKLKQVKTFVLSFNVCYSIVKNEYK